MSSFNLKPNLLLMGLQGGLFVLNLYGLNRLIYRPFLELNRKRKSLTSDRLAQAQALEAENDLKLASIEQKFKDARQSEKQVYEEVLSQAKKEREAQIGSSRQNLESLFNSFEQDLNQQLRQEKLKLRSTSEGLLGLALEKLGA